MSYALVSKIDTIRKQMDGFQVLNVSPSMLADNFCSFLHEKYFAHLVRVLLLVRYTFLRYA